MNRTVDILLTDLRYLINDLGTDGGQISPSIYDTAQTLRLAPPLEGIGPALNWLTEQQQPDGGWGDPVLPRTREVPTLAAMLALHTYGTRTHDRLAVRTALAFLKRQAWQWMTPLPDDLPVGVELLLPRLIEEAAKAGLDVPLAPYASLIALGNRRRRLIGGTSPAPAQPAIHSWEAWGSEPDLALLDGVGSVGHSPAATAAWLHAAAERADLADACAMAQRYLAQAAAATGMHIPGVVPTVWPIARFEQATSLYTLLIAGLLDHPRLRDVLQPQIDDLAAAMRPNGLGFSDFFTPNGQTTAAALAVLRAAGQPVDLAILKSFVDDDHYCAYQGELQSSISVTAHVVHVLNRFGETNAYSAGALIEHQLPDGRWHVDKWHGSWLYTTCQVLIALRGTDQSIVMKRAIDALLSYQHADGGWGMHGSTAEETAYGILALRDLLRAGLLDTAARLALGRAEQWMLYDYRPFSPSGHLCWLAKEVYRPLRLARTFELAATILAAEPPAEDCA
jgi:hypothetical protein